MFRSIFLFAFIAAGCGKNLDRSVKINSRTTPGEISFSLVEPPEVGGAWKRRMKITLENPGNLPIEKRRDGGPWQPIGFTHSDGEFIDTDISDDAEYRIGEVLNTGPMEGVKDFIWEGTLAGDFTIHAHRVVVLANKKVDIGKFRVDVKCDLFQIDGMVEAYPDGSIGGGNAGTLSVDANRFLVPGEILLRGQNGRTGEGGKPRYRTFAEEQMRWQEINPVGNTGEVGQAGGKGGQLLALASYFEINRVSASGGDGGAGGPGGPPMLYHPRSVGGPEGKAGAPGAVGLVSLMKK